MKEYNHTHEHDHGCSCHEHNHEHDHGCGCHEHGHEHEHNHSHDCCGHDHHHEGHTGHEFDKVSADIEQRVYILENLGCANCAAKMEEQIRQLNGVKMATITFATKQLRVAADNQEKLLPEIRQICSSIEEGVTVTSREETARGEKKESFFAENRREFIEIGAGATLFILGIVLEKLAVSFGTLAVIFVATYILLGRKIVWTAAKNLVKGHVFDENFLMSIATLAAFALGDFPEAVGVMLFYRIGELFEHMAVERSRSQIMEAVDLRPEVVNLVEGSQVRVIPAGEAKVGDILLIRPGDRVPLDGVVVEGESRLDTSPMTGEPVPVAVKAGSEILSGCVNEQGVLRMEVRKVLGDSMVTRILDSVENAAASKPKLDRFITRFARVYTPVVVLIAVLTAVLPSLVTGNWNHWIYTAITFLVISCPCALVLSVPLAFFSGIGAGSKKGILFKGGAAIEAIQNVKAIVMDKTGTVTKGEFRVQSVEAREGVSERELLQLAAQCELVSTHPIGNSIVEKARELHMELENPEQAEEISGKGIRAIISGREVLCGNKELLRAHGIDVMGAVDGRCSTEVLLARDMKFIGYLKIADTIKEDAKASIKEMKRQKLKTVMLTGDARQEADMVAEVTGIDEVYAKLLPEDKLKKLQEIRSRYGAVMFVGDGINDAPVLAGADVGAAMGSGADAAIEAADVVFMNSSVGAITQAIRIAKRTGSIAMQNVVVALAIKAFVMIFGLLGYANMWMAVFADTGVAMLCVLNSVRILYRTK